MDFINHLLVLTIAIAAISAISGAPEEKAPYWCTCSCPFNGRPICDTLEIQKSEIDANTEQLQGWIKYQQFLQNLKHNWRGEVVAIVETTIKDYISKGKLHAEPQHPADDGMMNDSGTPLKTIEDENDLAKNVSSLLEKVEMVENRTKDVEDELKIERRVRRSLEESVNQTRSSLVHIEDQLLNVSIPVDAKVNEVEMKLIASIGDLNKTIHEDVLQKLYYTVDGAVYENETKTLDERLESIEEELRNVANSSLVSKFNQDIRKIEESVEVLNNSIGGVVLPRLKEQKDIISDVLVTRIETLEVGTQRKDAVVEQLEDKMADLLNGTETFRNALVDIATNFQDVQSLEKKIHNFSEQMTRSLEGMQEQIEFLKNRTLDRYISVESSNEIVTSSIGQLKEKYTSSEDASIESGMYDIMPGEDTDPSELETNDFPSFDEDIFTIDPTEYESNDITEFLPTTEYSTSTMLNKVIVKDRSRMDGDSTYCDVPVITDPHLLVDVVQNEEGKQTLKFGCKPVGRYIVPPIPVPPRCENGSWRTPVPSCIELPGEATMKSLAEELQREHPCNSRLGEFPDPTNCTRFFKCAHGKVALTLCPHGLRFNEMLKVCDHARIVKCQTKKSKPVEELMTLIPPVHIEPDNLDRPNSLLATGKAGELIVYPGSSFTLHCLYPESIYGDPKWDVTYLNSGLNSRVLRPKKGINRVSLTVTAAKEEDSGIYRCNTPFGQKYDVEVLVKDVVCPALPEEEDSESVFYRPTPEGKLRILGTTAEIPCEDGHKVILRCTSSGKWSREFPSKDECTLKRRKESNRWECETLDLSAHPDLITERDDSEKKITFKCAGGKRLVGRTFTRCLDEGVWSHTSLPNCK